jgi:putative hydrolase of the HAD superfamily
MSNSRGMLDQTIVFDGDDTLWETQALYDDAKECFFSLLARRGFSPESVAAKFEEIDVGNVARLGFSRERFPHSMLETYEFCCRQAGQNPDETIARHVMALGSAVFDTRPAVRADAVDVLERLRKLYRIVLLTAGDHNVQRARIEQSQLGQYFDAVRIVPLKSYEAWSELVATDRLHPGQTWSVGNSVRSDINPAIALGMKCVLVAAQSWAYEQGALAVPVDGARLWQVAELTEAAQIMLSADDGHLSVQQPNVLLERLRAVRRSLDGAFASDTALAGSRAATPSAGHCAAVATIVYGMFGGQLLTTSVDGESHWLNRLPTSHGAMDIDLTGDQFNRAPVQMGVPGALYDQVILRRFEELHVETLQRAELLATRAGLVVVPPSPRLPNGGPVK